MSYSFGKSIVTDQIHSLWDAGNTLSYSGSGTTFTDIIRNSDGTANGTVHNTGFGGYWSFDGADDYITTNDANVTTGLEDGWSFSIWMRTSSTTAHEAFGFLDTGSGDAFRFEVNMNAVDASYASGKIGFFARDYNGQAYSADSSVGINDGDWHHVCIVINDPSTFDSDMYVDGVSQTVTNQTTQAGTDTFQSTAYSAHIGAVNNRGSLLRPYNGDIAYITIHKKALSASEVTENYNALKNRFVL